MDQDWPEDGSQLSFTYLVGAVLHAVHECYELKKKDSGDVDWQGPPLPKFLESSCLDFREKLTAESLAYAREERGLSAIEVLVGIAVQLGMEQGRRRHQEEIQHDVEKVYAASNIIKNTAFDLLEK